MLRTIAFAALLGMPAVAADAPVLRVLVYNYSTAPAQMIAEVELRVGRLLAEAEVTLEWLYCNDSVERCSGTVSPDMLLVRIIPGSDREVPKRLGGAIHPNFVNLWYDRIRSLPAGHRTVADVLSCVAAHELGHLLLGPGAHSRSGMMRPAWRDADPADTLPGVFQFSAEERRKIKLSAAARAAAR